MDDVVSPRGDTYSVTCHQWLTIGACARRILPTTCVQSCSVSRVSIQSSTRSAGQPVVTVIMSTLGRACAGIGFGPCWTRRGHDPGGGGGRAGGTRGLRRGGDGRQGRAIDGGSGGWRGGARRLPGGVHVVLPARHVLWGDHRLAHAGGTGVVPPLLGVVDRRPRTGRRRP